MVWVTWRQHRGEALAAVIGVVILAVLVVLTGAQMRTAFDAQGIAGCLGAVPPPSCGGVVNAYQQQFQMYISTYQWLNLVPLGFGIFVGAPLVAREVERQTHLLAWTQGVTRTRWIATKVVVLAGGAVLAGVAFTLLMTWWRQPLDRIDGSGLAPSAFDLEGLVPVGYFVGALAIGIAAGTLVRHTIPAMGVAIVGFLAARFGTLAFLRPNYMAAVLSSAPVGSRAPGAVSNGAWTLNDTLRDSAGNVINGRLMVEQLCGAGNVEKGSITQCLQQHGVVETLKYQPSDRFWSFQAIEMGIFLVLTAALLTLSVWWVRRRIS